MDTPFLPITRQTVSEQVRQQLVEHVTSGEIAPGQALPSERALSEHFGVARTSIREALQGLSTLGLVERRGNRLVVTEHLPSVSVAPVDRTSDLRKQYVRQLFETRRVLELPIFELAACRATDTQRRDIRTMAQRFHPGMPLAEFRRMDRRFHTTVARACGNPLLLELYGKVLAELFRSSAFDSLLEDEANQPSVAVIIGQSVAEHVEIAAAIADGDPVAVLSSSEHHLANVERRMVDDLV